MGMKKENFRKKSLPDYEQNDKCNKSLVSYESSSESEGESQFNFEFLDSDCEEFLDGKRLTTLVRRSYLRHLHQALNENYKRWSKISLMNDRDSFSGTAIAMCASELEKKALRACMMTNIYQKAMVQLMDEVRRSTKHCKLHAELVNQMDSSQRKWCDKETQTDDCLNSINKLIIKTDNVNTSSKVGSFIQNVPVVGQVKETVAKVPPLQRDTIMKAVKQKEAPPPKIESSDTLIFKPDVSTCKDSTAMNIVLPRGNPFDCGKLEKRKHDIKETIVEKCGVSRQKKMCTEKNKLSETKTRKQNLDDRLSKLTNLFGDSEVSQDCEPEAAAPPTGTPNQKRGCQIFNWHIELVAQVCNINNILFNMKSTRRASLERRFKDIFGGENDPITCITTAEITYCRKRIAEMVVAELTPFYLACRISSKYIFKELAKHITNEILNRTYAPGVDEVRKHVKGIFENGRCITNLNELNIVTID